MAALNAHTPFAGQTFAGRIASATTGLMAAFRTWNDTRQTRDALSRLTDRELDDIGLVRGDIDVL